MILTFSLRPIPFHQDNYSFQFDADNNSRCLCFPVFCFALFRVFFKIPLQHIDHNCLLSLLIAKRLRCCPSEEVIIKNTIAE